MKRFELYYPVNPHTVNRGWGVPDSAYAQFGFARHNGVDLALEHGQNIYAPIAGTVINVGNQPSGGGIFLSIVSDEQYQFDDNVCAYALLDFFHCMQILVNVGDSVSVGQVLALGDNTGFSTGHHTHMQPRRVRLAPMLTSSEVNTYRIRDNNYALFDMDGNDANNTFDPEPYWNKQMANPEDPVEVSRLKKIVGDLRQKLLALMRGETRHV